MDPLYVERVQQFFLTEFVGDNPLTGCAVIAERAGNNKKLVSVQLREEHMAKYWAIWKSLLIAMVTMSTQRTFVPELLSKTTKQTTRNILDIERAYLVATKPRYLDDVVEDCFQYIEDKQPAVRCHNDLGHLRLLQGFVSDLLCIENRYLANAVARLSETNQQSMPLIGGISQQPMSLYPHMSVGYDFDEIKELCETLRNIHDSISQLIRGL